MKSTKVLTTRNIAKIAVLSAVAFILMEFEIVIPFMPLFYKLDASEVVIMIGAFAMGPVAGIWMEALKNILNALIFGTHTAYIGELAAFVMGCAYVVPAAMIYQKNKSISTAIKGMVVGGVISTVVGMLTNYYVLIPAFVKFTNLSIDAIVGMCNGVNPYVTIDSLWGVILLGTLPFNLLKWLVVSILVRLLYKHVSPLLKKIS